MKRYKAIPTRQYHDTPELQPRFLHAENESEARQKIINNFDMSYKWDFVEVEINFYVLWYKGKKRKQTVGYKTLEDAERMRDSILADGYKSVKICKIQKELRA